MQLSVSVASRRGTQGTESLPLNEIQMWFPSTNLSGFVNTDCHKSTPARPLIHHRISWRDRPRGLLDSHAPCGVACRGFVFEGRRFLFPG